MCEMCMCGICKKSPRGLLRFALETKMRTDGRRRPHGHRERRHNPAPPTLIKNINPHLRTLFNIELIKTTNPTEAAYTKVKFYKCIQ